MCQDPKDTIRKVLNGNFAPEMLDSVLTSENVDTAMDDDDLGREVTPLLMATNIGNIPALKAILAVSRMEERLHNLSLSSRQTVYNFTNSCNAIFESTLFCLRYPF